MFPVNEIDVTFVRPNHASVNGKPDIVNLTIDRATCTATCDNSCAPGFDSLRVSELVDGHLNILCTARDLEGKASPGKPATSEFFPLCGTPPVNP